MFLCQLASFYDLRIADTIQELQDDFERSTPIEPTDVLEGNLNAPQSFGNLETFTIEVPIEENATIASFAFAVQAVDDVGQRSETSNVIQVTLRAYIPPPSEPNDPEKLSTGTIVGIVVGCVVAFVIIVVIALVVVKSRENGKTDAI